MLFVNSVLRKTGQWWKFLATITLIVTGGVPMIYGLANFGTGAPDSLLFFIFGGMGLVLFGFVFGCVAIRCDKCGTRLFWHAVSRQKSQVWLMWLLSESSCPNCDNGADTRQPE